jgi:23S rRNA A2030 N6-methylase RlmJ
VTTASGKPARALANRFANLADRTDQEVAKLRKIDPPSDAEDEYDAFVATLATIADDLRGISKAAAARDPGKARAETRSLLSDAQKTSKAETALRKAVD